MTLVTNIVTESDHIYLRKGGKIDKHLQIGVNISNKSPFKGDGGLWPIWGH